MEEEILYVLALKFTNGIGDVLAKQLISYSGSAKSVFSLPKGKLLKVPGIGNVTVQAILNSKGLELAKSCLSDCQKYEVKVIAYYDPLFPSKLRMVNDSPLVLFYKGGMLEWNRKVVGVVGTRKASVYGKETTERIVAELKAHDVIVVSGLAYGIDVTAHKASLKNEIPTIGVLAGGLDKVYPAVHNSVAIEMVEKGMLISEHPPGVKPDAHNFPARNRIIAGLTDVLIVVEAAKKGGALITANISYSYNREVFAVPGKIGDKFSEGCNLLISSQRALMYNSIKDLEFHLNWEAGKEAVTKRELDLTQFDEEESKVITVLQQFESGLQLDELSWKAELTVNKTISLLLILEFAGFVKSLPGKIYKLSL
ncbi:MAG: DNA-processing protein DprA [Reichenbachiella sp.]